MTKFIRFTLINALFFLAVQDLSAQPGAGDPNGGEKPGAVPIGGVEILLLAGGALGARKIILGKKRNDKL